MSIKNIVFKKRYCVKCFKFRYVHEKTLKPYVAKVTGGTNYCCIKHSKEQNLKFSFFRFINILL